jgi:Ca2+-transporting ATPase
VQARVVREGVEARVPAAELVPGDVLLLAEGEHISADGRVVEESRLRVDQSTLTGESRPVRRNAWAVPRDGLAHQERPNMVFAGTHVASGTGRVVVTATGMQTQFGQIAHLTQSVQTELSPLQREMQSVTRIVSAIAVGVGALCFVLAEAFAGMAPLQGFMFMLGMIVAFVPEGLLPTVTLALAMGVQRMAGRGALVKRLSAVETLGCATVICTDKTGTLTQNEMTVTDLWVGGQSLVVTGVGYGPSGTIGARAGDDPPPIVHEDLTPLLLAAGLCEDARLIPPNIANPRWTALGDPTEAALRVVATKGGLDLEHEAQRAPRLRELPFDSLRKRMSTIHQLEPVARLEQPSAMRRVAYVKGAPRETLALCTRLRCAGREVPLDPAQRDAIIAANDGYARRGLRVLAVAMRDLPETLSEFTPRTVECDLTLLGLVALMDPPRPEVANAVARCHRAGIRVVMITGDYGLTAESVGRQIGIVRGASPRLLNGTDLDAMEPAALQAALQDEVLLARVAPAHKLRVVRALQAMGHVVAVTGDGVNDAPALKQADIGVAMGLTGSDTAKAAADMILTDDNFATIVNAVEEGRTVYANIKKFITYIFTSNTPEAVPFIVHAFSGGRIPLALNVMQILAIDLGTDILPALALGAEPPESGLMERPPRDRAEHAITTALLIRAYLWLGSLQSLAVMAAFYAVYRLQGLGGSWLTLPDRGAVYAAATTTALATVVCTQIGNLFAQRTETASVFHGRLFTNPLVWGGIAWELILLVLIVYCPALQWVFGTEAPPAAAWMLPIACTPLLCLADEARKAVQRWLTRRSGRDGGAGSAFSRPDGNRA